MIVHQLPKELADRAAELADILAPDGSITAAAAVRDLCRECYAAGRAVDESGELAACPEALAAGEWDVWGICAACGGEEPTGHRDNCATQIALSGERGPKLAAIIEAAQRVRDWSVRMPDEPVPGVVYDLIAAVVASEEDR